MFSEKNQIPDLAVKPAEQTDKITDKPTTSSSMIQEPELTEEEKRVLQMMDTQWALGKVDDGAKLLAGVAGCEEVYQQLLLIAKKLRALLGIPDPLPGAPAPRFKIIKLFEGL